MMPAAPGGAWSIREAGTRSKRQPTPLDGHPRTVRRRTQSPAGERPGTPGAGTPRAGGEPGVDDDRHRRARCGWRPSTVCEVGPSGEAAQQTRRTPASCSGVRVGEVTISDSWRSGRPSPTSPAGPPGQPLGHAHADRTAHRVVRRTGPAGRASTPPARAVYASTTTTEPSWVGRPPITHSPACRAASRSSAWPRPGEVTRTPAAHTRRRAMHGGAGGLVRGPTAPITQRQAT